MTFFDSIILGILQGVTEFLPVSSSGHLVLLEKLIGEKEVPLLYDIILHVASLLAVIIFFRKKIWELLKSLTQKKAKKDHFYILIVILSTFVTGGMVVFTKPVVYFLRENPVFISVSFLFTACILMVAQFLFKRASKNKEVGVKDSIFIGFFQGIAVLPGVSRSGSTIAAGLLMKIPAEKAVEYSFILSIPAILGALVLETAKGSMGSIDLSIAVAGFIASFAASVVSLKFLVLLIKKTVLYPFAIYLFIMAMVLPFVF
jgi:undecaprenyl-diphosphatase